MTQRVCISLPTRQNVHAETVSWLLRAYTELAPNVEVQIVHTPHPLEYVRNEQVRRFLASDCTHLFLLDSDCVPQDGTLQRLLAHDLPFVTAPGATRIGDETGLLVLDRAPEGRGYVSHFPLDGMQQVAVTGCAGMLIRRDVLMEMVPPGFRFEMGEDGSLIQGEDFGFCERLQQSGVEIWADCDLVQRHWVTVPL